MTEEEAVKNLDQAIRDYVKAESGGEQIVTDWVLSYGSAARSESAPNGVAEISGYLMHDDTMPYAACGLAQTTVAKLTSPGAWGGA